MTEQRTIYECIILVVAFDFLHDNFKMTTALILHSGDKDLEEIQQIVTSTKAANMAKQIVGVATDLIMMFKNNRLERSDSRLNEEYFNCEKEGHYTRDCCSSSLDKRKIIEELSEKAKHAR